MLTCKCKNCGGQLEFAGTGGLVCPYCGTKAFFSDEDLKGNGEFRKMLLSYLKAEAERKENDHSADRLFRANGRDVFRTGDHQELQIGYMEKYKKDGYTCYLARGSVVYVFERRKDADSYMEGLGRLAFPAADMKLHRSFPELSTRFSLEDGKEALIFKRRPNLYPVGLFAPLPSEHLAWVISRMENICCALCFSGIEHGGIAPDTVWIDPLLHEAVLFGDWRNVRALRKTGDLADLRKTALMLSENADVPKELGRFLRSSPEKDAYSDFGKWDRVIEEGFGGHRFSRMSVGKE